MSGIVLSEQVNKIDSVNEIHIKEEQHGDEVYRVTYQVTLDPEGTINTCIVIGNEFIRKVEQPPIVSPGPQAAPQTQQEQPPIVSPGPQAAPQTQQEQQPEPKKEEETNMNNTPIAQEITPETQAAIEAQKEYVRPNVPVDDPRYKTYNEQVAENQQALQEQQKSNTEELRQQAAETNASIAKEQEKKEQASPVTHTVEKQELPQTGTEGDSGIYLGGFGLMALCLFYIGKKIIKK